MALPVRIRASAQPVIGVGAGCGHEHLVEFYETEEFLVETVSSFLQPALDAGDATIVVATEPHRRAFNAALRASGVDVDMAVAAGRHLSLDAAELLATFLVGGEPDRGRFREAIGGVIERATTGGRRVRIYGEMVAILWQAGDVASAIALEDLWNELAAGHEFSLLCAYPMDAFEGVESAAAFRRICDQHTTVIPGESYWGLTSADEEQRVVARLQQETASLRAEIARLRAEQEVLADLAYLDGMTGLGNRRAFDRDLEREWALSMRDGIDSFVLVADLDGFKQYNDLHGHAAGDEVLRQFAGALQVAARSTDILARIGGDEFGILLVRCQERAAQCFKSRVREAMADAARPALGGLDCSLGHASLRRATSAAKALEHADLAMFARKRAARLGVSAGPPDYPEND